MAGNPPWNEALKRFRGNVKIQWIVVFPAQHNHLCTQPPKSAFVMWRKALLHSDEGAQSSYDLLQWEIPPENLNQLSRSLTAPEVVRERKKKGEEIKKSNALKKQDPDANKIMWENFYTSTRWTKSAKSDITSIMKTNWKALRLLGSMGVLRAFCVFVCVFVSASTQNQWALPRVFILQGLSNTPEYSVWREHESLHTDRRGATVQGVFSEAKVPESLCISHEYTNTSVDADLSYAWRQNFIRVAFKAGAMLCFTIIARISLSHKINLRL